jgi:hypothetical protein
MANQRIEDLFASNPVTSPSGNELIECSVPDGLGGYVSGAGKQSVLGGGGGGTAIKTGSGSPVGVVTPDFNPGQLYIDTGTGSQWISSGATSADWLLVFSSTVFGFSIGFDALINAASGAVENTAVGINALKTNTTGYGNTAIGFSALQLNVDGTNNTAVGSYALRFLAGGAGVENSALGASALYACVSGEANNAFGFSALTALTTGSYNEAFGVHALYSLTTGSNNDAMGFAAFRNLVTGSNNVGIGYNVGISYTGAESGNIVIGNAGVTGESNVVRIGTSQTDTYLAGNVHSANLPVAIFKAAISQAGSADPTFDFIACNTLTGGTPVLARSGAGVYTLTLTGAFNAHTLATLANCYGGSFGASGLGIIIAVTDDVITFATELYGTSGGIDGLLSRTFISIEVWP